MDVLVIGCGPAGLAAAHAAAGLVGRNNVTVLAPKHKTSQQGPLLIQRPIPGINTTHPDGTIHQVVIGGSILDYRYKLYGDINIGINGDQLKPSYHAWDHRKTYDALWDMYEDRINDDLISKERLVDASVEHDLVVSTANARSMCYTLLGNAHRFMYAQVAVTPVAEYPGQPDDTIVFNAGEEYAWVRSSRVFGVEVTEWPLEHAPAEARLITKPIKTDCVCYPHVLRTGRFGKWQNETWVDTAYWDTYSAITSMQRASDLARIK